MSGCLSLMATLWLWTVFISIWWIGNERHKDTPRSGSQVVDLKYHPRELMLVITRQHCLSLPIEHWLPLPWGQFTPSLGKVSHLPSPFFTLFRHQAWVGHHDQFSVALRFTLLLCHQSYVSSLWIPWDRFRRQWGMLGMLTSTKVGFALERGQNWYSAN